MNEDLRRLLDGNIKKALADAKLASSIKHPGLIGKLRELFLDNLIIPLLNSRYSTGSGKLTDHEGHLSKEIDLCVYSTSLLPGFFFSSREDIGIYPIESVLGCFEIKSILSLNEMRDAYAKFSLLEKELQYTPGTHDQLHRPVPHYFSKPECSIFAYDIDRKSYGVTTILDMYKKVDPGWNTNPLISSICVADKGCLIHTTKGWLHMAYNSESQVNEEIIFYLCAMIQGFPLKEISRGTPRIGYYLTDPIQTARFENGVPVKSPWGPYKWVITNTPMDSIPPPN